MKTISILAFGGPEQLQLMDMAQPRPAEGEALVKLDYAGINFIDVYMRSGHYARSQTYQTPLPMTLGMEGAGTVAAAHIDVDEVDARINELYQRLAVGRAWLRQVHQLQLLGTTEGRNRNGFHDFLVSSK